ncbi:MAG: lipoate--protein ligase [Chitinophagales bacterium]|nr:lipoate--protein ligase [Chitinophagales bacterium]
MILLELPEHQSPYFYAAAEEWLVRNASFAEEVLLLYVNQPCVVIGKNQCLWSEVNWNYIFNPQSIIVRRVSGGGTVYHDQGNLCFSFISAFDEQKVNNYKWFNQPVVDALGKMGIDAAFSPRNDILFQGKKISGNAQFTNRKNILSHGTLLFQANLEQLRLALKPNAFTVETKAVSSVRSPVMNLSEVYASSFEDFKTTLTKYLPIAKKIVLTKDQLLAIHQLAEEQYATKTWIYGKSPKAQIQKGDLTFSIENGCLFNVRSVTTQLLLEALDGVEFHPEAVQPLLNEIHPQHIVQQLMKGIFF